MPGGSYLENSTSERLLNLAFGLSFFSWACLGLWRTDDAGSLVRWSIAALHVAAGCLIIFRAPVKWLATPWQMSICLPAVVSAGFVFRLALPSDQWPVSLSLLFLSSTLWTITALFWLGNSFAVLPAIRDIVGSGPYRWVRHPAYLGELGMVSACLLATNPSNALIWSVAAGLLCLSSVVVRILVEERVLLRDPAYQQFCLQNRWRLIPRIW